VPLLDIVRHRGRRSVRVLAHVQTARQACVTFPAGVQEVGAISERPELLLDLGLHFVDLGLDRRRPRRVVPGVGVGLRHLDRLVLREPAVPFVA
jgi:hypothetical protein